MSRTTVRLPDDLLEQAQVYAAQTGRTFTQLLSDALRFELQRGTAPRRVAEPLPTYGGSGLQAGVDLSSNGALLDHMDAL
ncbi:MAG: CopG family transcriptional regulator [Gemmatimonas sp.]|jgi:hypothetical protein|uniref:ribbon-helix-helix domain-containing protein n=1 Tax=Gemmatimonas sp. TaxID=1962908 RepID=UPI0031C4708F|nr:CopG family transcriptional regulator [Gemmatimonas sp.]